MFNTFREAQEAQARSGAPAADPTRQALTQARAKQDRYFQSLQGQGPRVHRRHDLSVQGPHGDVPVRLLKPGASDRLPVIVFLRGAGFWAGGLDSHSLTTHSLALHSDCAVCAVDYRRTPESAWPVQRDELVSVLAWLRRHAKDLGVSNGPPVLFGESAGATLALSAALALRDDGIGDALAGLILFYNNAGGPRATARPYSQWVWQQYLGGADPAAIPGPVPLIQRLNGLPPAWLGCGDADPLLEDTQALSRQLTSAGVPHAVRIYRDMPHAFLMYAATLRPAADALLESAAAARQFLVSSST